MKALAVGIIAVLCMGCQPANAPDHSREIARGAILSAETIWMGMAQACVDSDDSAVQAQCIKVLGPARDVLVDAAAAVDTWTAADSKNVPCMLADVKNVLVEMTPILKDAGFKTPQAALDTINLLSLVGNSCSPDGGKK